MSKRILFFAAEDDVSNLLLAVERQISLKYYSHVIHDPALDSAICYKSITEIEGIGLSSAKDVPNSRHFIIMAADKDIAYITREDRKGVKYSTANLNSNPDFIYFTPGGTFQNCVLAGEVSLKEKLNFNVQMMKIFDKEIKRSENKLNSYHILEKAQNYKTNGYRLTNNCGYPESHDII